MSLKRDLLIVQGVNLVVIFRPVSGPGAPVEGGLAGALARALHERSRAIQQTDESSSDSDDDQEEDEWDD